MVQGLRKISQASGFLHRLKRKKIFGLTYISREDIQYQRQVRRERLRKKQIREIKAEIENFSCHPLISIVMPVYNVEGQWLEKAIQSVLNQVYPYWELCIADDASPLPHIRPILEKYQEQDQRVHVVYLEKNLGISGASNEALKLVSGEWVAFLDHDDEISPDALFEVARVIQRDPGTGIIYSDEDKLSMGGMRLRPVLKSDWNPGLFLTHNYLCHLVVCRTDLVRQVGGCRRGFEGSQDYDLLLRITELTSRVVHIPRVLYHWRMIPGSAAAIVDAKSTSFERARQALKEALERRGLKGTINDGQTPGTFKVNI